jgi:hypothetical protein
MADIKQNNSMIWSSSCFLGGSNGIVGKRFEPLNTNRTCFWIYRIAKAFTFPLEPNLNIDKNRSTLSVGGFAEICAPSRICSEPPSLKSGKMGTKGLSFHEFN